MRSRAYRSSSMPAVALLALVLGTAACGSREPPAEIVERPGEPDVMQVAGDDEVMNAAISEAQATLDDFVASLSEPAEGQSAFSVKARLEEGDSVEHIWLSDPQATEEGFSGALGNEPLELEGFVLGQSVSVPREQVSDWMYIEDGVLRGGFTILALRDLLPEEERQAFEDSLPFRLE